MGLCSVGELYFGQMKRPKNCEKSKSQRPFHHLENEVEVFMFSFRETPRNSIDFKRTFPNMTYTKY